MKILCLGDLHAGSRYSPWPADYPLATGDANEKTTWGCSLAQKMLNKFWAALIKDAKRHKPDVIILNGDMIEGGNYRSVDVVTIRNDEQIGGARALLRPLVDTAQKKVFMLRGTGFHVGRGGENEAVLAHLLGVEYLPELYLQTPAGVVNALHHIGTTTRPMLEQNALGNALGDKELELLRAHGRERMPDLRCIVRSHRHRSIAVTLPSGRLAVTLAPFQLKTDFGYKVAPNTEPQVSYIWLMATEKGFDTETVSLEIPPPIVREV